jgi:hypothetical protein
VTIDGVELTFAITDGEVPTLAISTAESKVGQNAWRDGGRRRLENELNRFVAQLLLRAGVIKHDRQKREELERYWAEEHRQREAQEKAAAEYRRRETELHSSIARWRLAKDIRAYVTEAHRMLQDAGAYPVQGGPIESSLSWAAAYADRLDPVNGLRANIMSQLEQQGGFETHVGSGPRR